MGFAVEERLVESKLALVKASSSGRRLFKSVQTSTVETG